MDTCQLMGGPDEVESGELEVDDADSEDGGDENPGGNGWDAELEFTNLTGEAFSLGPITWDKGRAVAKVMQAKT